MTTMPKTQSSFSATYGDVSSAARAFSAILLLPGAVFAASLFIALPAAAGLLLPAAILLLLLYINRNYPGREPESC